MNDIVHQNQFAFSELNGVVAVAAHGNFRRAAAELGVSASALSHAVASLERRLGVRLFHRTTRSVSVSEAGARFLERVRPALREIGDAMETINDFRDTPRGTLRINASELAALRIFEPLILPFVERYPDMSVDLVTERRLVDIVASGFDAGLRFADTVPQEMVAVPCGPPVRLLVVGAPAYFNDHPRPRSPADLHSHRCIMRRMPSGTLLAWEFNKGAESITVDVHGSLTLDSDALMLPAVLRGFGLAWMFEWSVEHFLRDRRLVSVLDDWSPPFPGLCLYYPSNRHMSAGLRAFIKLIWESGVGAASRSSRPGADGTKRKTKRLGVRRRRT